jgi:spermidine synthase
VKLFVLTLLTCLSGICGIAYEVIYAHIFTALGGYTFYTSASLLFCFMFGISVGSFVGYRKANMLPLVEISIGVYALFIAVLFKLYGLNASFLFDGALQTSMSVIIALLIPTILIGMSIPMFTCYIHNYLKSNSEQISYIYWVYNLGAVVSILLLEYFVIYSYGITLATSLIACINIIIGIILWKYFSDTPIKNKPNIIFNIERKIWVYLLGCSISSAIFQLLFLRVVYQVFGSRPDKLTLTLSLVFTGIVLGTWLASFIPRKKVTIALVSIPFILSIPWLLVEHWIYLITFLNEYLDWVPVARTALYIILFGIIPFTAIGMLLPLVWKLTKTASDHIASNSTLLALSSIGNMLGFLMMILFLYEVFSEKYLALIILVLAFTVSIPFIRIFYIKFLTITTMSIIMMSILYTWPSELLSLAKDSFSSRQNLENSMSYYLQHNAYRKHDSRVVISHAKEGRTQLQIDEVSNVFVNLSQESYKQFHGIFSGVAPAAFVKNRDDALVVGLGIGTTAGIVGKIFNHTDVVEINPIVVEDIVPYFKEYNFYVGENEKVDIYTQDGVIFLSQSDKRYDLITVIANSSDIAIASNIYTKEFFDIARLHLTNDGIFSIYVPHAIADGLAITIKTIYDSFDSNCAQLFIGGGKTIQIVCGSSALSLAKTGLDWSENVKLFSLYYFLDDDISRVMNALIFEKNELKELTDNTPVNTIDHRILNKYLMYTRLVNATQEQSLIFSRNKNLSIEPFTNRKLSKEEVRYRCKVLSRAIEYFSQCYKN